MPGVNDCREELDRCRDLLGKACSSFDINACLFENYEGDPTSICEGWVQAGARRDYLASDAYRCGEIPLGTTHYDCKSNEKDKLLAHFSLWDRFHRVKIGRKGDQTRYEFTTFDLSERREIPLQLGPEMTAKAIWLSLSPRPPNLDLQVCVRLPGTTAYGPDITYDPTDTPSNAIKRIDFGKVRFSGIDLCGLATLRIVDPSSLSKDEIEACFGELEEESLEELKNGGPRPCAEWKEITRFDTFGMTAFGQKVDKSALFYVQVVASALAGGALGPLIPTIVVGGLVAVELIELMVEHDFADDILNKDLAV